MPRRYKRKLVKRKRKPKKLPLGGFPKSHMVRLRYVTECVITCSGLSRSHSYSANGMYDPDITGTGHQPKAFDQWMLIYNHYNVVGSKVSAKLVSTHGADNYIWGVTTTPTNDQLDGKLLSYCLENRYNTGYRTIGSQYSNSGQRALSNVAQTSRYSQKAQFGKNSSQKANLTGNAAANPTEQQMFELWIAPVNNVASNQTASFIVTIDYLALLTEPRILAQS